MRICSAAAAVALALAGCTGAGAGMTALGGDERPALAARLQEPVAPEALQPGLFDEAVLVYVNAARAGAGQPPLRRDPGLGRAAQEHAANMARLRSHSHRLEVPGQGRLVQRMDRQGVRYRVAGENIAMEKLYRLAGRPVAPGRVGCRFTYADTREPVPLHTYATLAEAAVARWMASPKHRASVLRSDFRRMGSGLGIDPGGEGCGDIYLVQNFAD